RFSQETREAARLRLLLTAALVGRGAAHHQVFRLRRGAGSAAADLGDLVAQILTVPDVGSEPLDTHDLRLDLVPLARPFRMSIDPARTLHHAAVRPMFLAMGGQTVLAGERRVASPRVVVPPSGEQSIAFPQRGPRGPWL